MNLRRLQKSGIALASGDLSYRVDTKGLLGDFKKHGENLNDISKGMNLAIEKQMKSERMKTELITNVSHDIKTPLTSIINYADLIGKEKTNNKKITEYAEVLTRQSEKLKRLIEDLVEASKASTGNLEVELAICDAAVFVNQASGEYQNRMKESSLTLLTSVPEEELRIMADSRRMWRIFDNLMNNICKYAQPDTRVYLSLEKEEDKAVFTFRNTSREQLNISEEELMERFTRGDASRNTEGNGLGLSIARSMAQLQNGDLKISIDGDLFKAILSFPLI
jgi:signal transduction histidine kinase